MKTRKFISILVVFVMLFTLTSIDENKYCFAEGSASASISVSGSKTVGSTITVNFTISGNKFGAADGTLMYPSDKIEFIRSTSGHQAGGGNGSVRFNMVYADPAVSSMTCSLSFKVLKSGSCTISTEALNVFGDDNDNPPPLSCNLPSKTISLVDNTPAASTNANLSSLKVSAGSLSPGFSPSTTSYTVNVGNSVTTCAVSATAADSKASVSISGDSSLSVGENVRKIVVTAESGATKTYTVKIIRAKASSGSSSGGSSGGSSGSGSSSGSSGGGSSSGSGTGSQTTEPDPTENDDNDDETKPDEEPEEEKPKEIEVEIDGEKYVIVENLLGTTLPEGFKLDGGKYDDKEIPVIVDQSGKIRLANLRKPDATTGAWFYFDEEKQTFKEKAGFTFDELVSYGEKVSEAVKKEGEENSQRLENELNKANNEVQKLGEDLQKANKDKSTLVYGVGGLIALELLLAIIMGVTKKIKKKKNNAQTDNFDV